MFLIHLAYDSNVRKVTRSSNKCLRTRLILLKNGKTAGSQESREEKTLPCIWTVNLKAFCFISVQIHSRCIFEQKRKITNGTAVGHFTVQVCVIVLNNEC